MRVLVCGGRDYPYRARVMRELDKLTTDEGEPMPRGGVVIIHGACPTGADRWADDWAVINWVPCQEYRADWATHGKAAGPIRNQRMIDDGKPDLVLAFEGGRGTADMLRRARAAGVKVIEVAP